MRAMSAKLEGTAQVIAPPKRDLVGEADIARAVVGWPTIASAECF